MLWFQLSFNIECWHYLLLLSVPISSPHDHFPHVLPQSQLHSITTSAHGPLLPAMLSSRAPHHNSNHSDPFFVFKKIKKWKSFSKLLSLCFKECLPCWIPPARKVPARKVTAARTLAYTRARISFLSLSLTHTRHKEWIINHVKLRETTLETTFEISYISIIILLIQNGHILYF